MSAWSYRRKFFTTIIIITLILSIVSLAYFLVSSDEPTCFDGIQNQGEIGVDCGDVCQNVCTFESSQPKVLWTRIIRGKDSTYDIVSYVRNPNGVLFAKDVPYTIEIFSEESERITTIKGLVDLHPLSLKRVNAIVERGIKIDGRVPDKAFLTIDQMPVWNKIQDIEKKISIKNERILEDNNGYPLVIADVENLTDDTLRSIDFTSTVFDENENAVGVSKTFIRELKGEEERPVRFTWRNEFDTTHKECSQSPSFVIFSDIRGDMREDIEKSFDSILETLNKNREKVGVVVRNDVSASATQNIFITNMILSTDFNPINRDNAIEEVSKLFFDEGIESDIEITENDESKKILFVISSNKSLSDFNKEEEEMIISIIERGVEVYLFNTRSGDVSVEVLNVENDGGRYFLINGETEDIDDLYVFSRSSPCFAIPSKVDIVETISI